VRILFLETEPVTSEVRLRPLLDQLVRTGEIESYAVIDRDMSVRPAKSITYDVALTHRIPNARQIRWLRRHAPPLVYDIDDLFRRPVPKDPGGGRRGEADRWDWCLRNADVISSPSPRLMRALQESYGAALGGVIRRLPNCGRETPAPRKLAGRPRLIWSSSSAHQWNDELRAITNGIAAAARELRIDVQLAGRFPEALPEALPRSVTRASWIPFPQFMDSLASGPFIAVAPLASALAANEQEFVDCKSDIKAAQYGSSRIAAAFSTVAPYRDSELPLRMVPVNTSEAWRIAIGTLVEEFPASGNLIGDDPAFQGRRPSVVATTLLELLEAARQPSRPPFSYRCVPTPHIGRQLEQVLRSFRTRLFSRRAPG